MQKIVGISLMTGLALAMGVIIVPGSSVIQKLMAQLDPSQGNNDGIAAAQNDWQSGAGFHPGCQDHNINPVGNEDYCGAYKSGYIYEWGRLVLVH